MAKKVLLAVADGSEEIELVAPVDILRRADLDVTVASVDNLEITCSNGTRIIADKLISDVVNENFDLIVLPGGMPGSLHLRDNIHLETMLKKQNAEEKYIAAICAAPIVVLQHHGLLENKTATCHPSMWSQLNNTAKKADKIVVDKNIITSQGPGTVLEFSIRLVELLTHKNLAEKVSKSLAFS